MWVDRARRSAPHLWVIGGFGNAGILGYDVTADTWDVAAHPALPGGVTDVHDAAVGTIDGIVYLAGGVDAAGTALTTCYAFDPAADSWSTKASVPTATKDMGFFVHGGKLYLIGGWNNASGSLSTVQIYDPATDSWSSGASTPTPWRGAVCGVIGGIAYCAGGLTSSSNAGLCYSYDPATDSWSAALATMPTHVWDAAGGAVAGRLVVVGGLNPSSATVANVQIYDPGANSWSAGTSMANAMDEMACVAVGDLLYKMGGTTNDGNSGKRDWLYVYDIAANSWTQLTSAPGQRYGHVMAAS